MRHRDPLPSLESSIRVIPRVFRATFHRFLTFNTCSKVPILYLQAEKKYPNPITCFSWGKKTKHLLAERLPAPRMRQRSRGLLMRPLASATCLHFRVMTFGLVSTPSGVSDWSIRTYLGQRGKGPGGHYRSLLGERSLIWTESGSFLSGFNFLLLLILFFLDFLNSKE